MPVSFGIFKVQGWKSMKNYVLYRPAPSSTESNCLNRCVVFFPGDISDFFAPCTETLSFQDEKWLCPCTHYPYSLEALAWILASKFPNDAICIIRPRLYHRNWACYINFIRCDEIGTPWTYSSCDHSVSSSESSHHTEYSGGSSQHAVYHLTQLIIDLVHKVHPKKFHDSNMDTLVCPFSRLVLVGFSKGASVLTSLLRETDTLQVGFWSHIEAIHYVDPGVAVPDRLFDLSDGKCLRRLRNLFLDTELISGTPGVEDESGEQSSNSYPFVSMNQNSTQCSVVLHGSPRQLEDPSRPFLRQECEHFLNKLVDSGISAAAYEYFKNTPPSLNMHFETLLVFDPEGVDKTNKIYSHKESLVWIPRNNSPWFFDEWERLSGTVFGHDRN